MTSNIAQMSRFEADATGATEATVEIGDGSTDVSGAAGQGVDLADGPQAFGCSAGEGQLGNAACAVLDGQEVGKAALAGSAGQAGNAPGAE